MRSFSTRWRAHPRPARTSFTRCRHSTHPHRTQLAVRPCPPLAPLLPPPRPPPHPHPHPHPPAPPEPAAPPFTWLSPNAHGCTRLRLPGNTCPVAPALLPPSPSVRLRPQARKYFAHALELKPAHNLRALYGLLLCCAATSGGKASKASTAELLAFVQPAILEEYASCGGGHATPMLKLAQGMMDTLAA